ncbi:MAG TPA: GxxExxY protein [Bacteroidetes bacterium]|nr:GxxExxY protein [Bacteroidota bacterium]
MAVGRGIAPLSFDPHTISKSPCTRIKSERLSLIELFKFIKSLAQILTYLKLSGCKLGFLINFNVRRIKDGIRRVVNNLDES